ncbi:MAG: GHMP kinase, partial [Xanthobacteraceae bacterium]
FSEAGASHLCRLVLMKALPALAECNIADFGSAIKEMQMLLGDYFAAIQGGSRFSSPDVAAALGVLEDEGAFGIGQSSWGPTGFAFASSVEEANRLLESIRRQPRYRDLDIRAVSGLNRGAQIVSHVEAGEPERYQR